MDISKCEIPADAMPGVGLEDSTHERDQNKKSRIAGQYLRAWYMLVSSNAAKSKSLGGGGSLHTLLSVGNAGTW
ncbi:hypothetical protein ACFL6S_18025 [Candidatus Poribacteria bacterium]